MIVIEANEIPISVFEWYSKEIEGPLSEALKNNFMVKTVLDDVEEKYLYPSQAWASISTGLPANMHNIRWYNEAKPEHKFYWREASKNNKDVALMNVLHTGSIRDQEVKNYSFLFPDFFSIYPIVNKNLYKNFQIFNHHMSVSSGRKTSKKDVLLKAFFSFLKYPLPRAWGLSLKDASKWLDLLKNARKDGEVLRNAQFLLQSRIFLNEIKNKNIGSDLSVFFTNHVASCLHRNFHDLNTSKPEDKDKKTKILMSMKILDNFIFECKKLYPHREILIISAMGQKLNKEVDEKYKEANKIDYKLTDIKKFLEYFTDKVDTIDILNEMIPQYTFKFSNEDHLNKFISKINSIGSDPNAMRFGYYVPKGKASNKTKGFFCHADVKRDLVTCTVSVRPDENGNVLLDGREINFSTIGFSSLQVNDYHHGEHSKFGCLISIKDSSNLEKMHFSEIKNFILSKIYNGT